ncbi:MAG TPA: alpha/beta fold hydrolase, partial [Caldilineaceae bacterium]|nr:alpha/beta fold hydrolase [Caldilineaceae bacterium]
MQSYLNFDLQIVPAAQGYLAQVIFSPVGQAAALIVLPFSEHELQQPLDMLGGAVRHVRPVGNKANAGLPTVTPGELGPKELGTQLFKAVVRDEIVVCLRRSLDAARRAEAGLRIRLRLTGAPALAALPWEYLFDPSRDQFLALVDELSIVRYLDLPEPEAVLPVAPPLRVLAVLSDPVNIAPRLDVGREWALLQKAISGLGADQVVLDRLPAVTVDSLRQRLGADDVHVLHFIGHGWFDAGGNGLVCEDTAGRGVKVAADVLGVLQYEDLRDVVLIGHSYGGMVATGVTDRAEGRVAKLIYLDAFAP